MRQDESKLQTACVEWFRWNYPKLHLNLFAIPNGGHRNVVTASRLKREGVTAGVADLFLAVTNKQSPGLFIEMKLEGNYQQPSQKAFEAAITPYQYQYVICRSLQDFIETIKSYIGY